MKTFYLFAMVAFCLLILVAPMTLVTLGVNAILATFSIFVVVCGVKLFSYLYDLSGK